MSNINVNRIGEKIPYEEFEIDTKGNKNNKNNNNSNTMQLIQEQNQSKINLN